LITSWLYALFWVLCNLCHVCLHCMCWIYVLEVRINIIYIYIYIWVCVCVYVCIHTHIYRHLDQQCSVSTQLALISVASRAPNMIQLNANSRALPPHHQLFQNNHRSFQQIRRSSIRTRGLIVDKTVKNITGTFKLWIQSNIVLPHPLHPRQAIIESRYCVTRIGPISIMRFVRPTPTLDAFNSPYTLRRAMPAAAAGGYNNNNTMPDQWDHPSSNQTLICARTVGLELGRWSSASIYIYIYTYIYGVYGIPIDKRVAVRNPNFNDTWLNLDVTERACVDGAEVVWPRPITVAQRQSCFKWNSNRVT